MEKFQAVSRQKILFFTRCFLLLQIIMFVSCRKDISSSSVPLSEVWQEEGIVDIAYIQTAKQWFENMKTNPKFKAVDSLGLQPQWDKALRYGNKIEI